MEDPERRDQARKRKKWKQNLAVLLTDEEDQSSDSDVENKTTSIFENNDALALRFPYPLVSDDSDDDNKDLSGYPRVLPNTEHVNKCIMIASSSDENTEPNKENESYKHKKRKPNQKQNLTTTRINNDREAESSTYKDSTSIKNKQQRSKRSSCSNSSKVSKNNVMSSKSYNIPKTEKTRTVSQKADTLLKTESSAVVNFEPENSWNNTYHNTRQVSKSTLGVKRTSGNTRNKLQRNKTNSRFLDSSSEEEVFVQKPVRRHSKFKRIHLMSSSSSSSDDNELHNKVQKEITHLLSSSSSSSGKEESIVDNDNNGHQTQKPVPDISHTKLGLRKTHNVHSLSSSSDSEDSEKHLFVPKKNNNKHPSFKVPLKNTPLLCSSRLESNKSLISKNNIATEENQNHVNPDEVDENKAQKTKINEMVQCKSHLHTDAWKNIATVQLKRPKSSSTHHQSYLQTLKKQFISSNPPSVEIHKKFISKTLDKRDDIKSNKESFSSKSNTVKEDITQGERLNTCLPSYPQKRSSTSDNNQDKQQPMDLNINMNLQITCSPSLVENMNSFGNSISKTPAENNNEALPSELDINLSLSHQENKKTEISSCQNINLSCSAERNGSSKAKYNDSNKLKCNTHTQLKLPTCNQTKQSGLKEELIIINPGKKVVKSESRKKVFTENNASGNDLLNSILLEMDSNPFSVKKVLPKEALESHAEMHRMASLTPHLPSTPSQSHLPVNLLSAGKGKESMHHQCQLENKLPAFSKHDSEDPLNIEKKNVNSESWKKVFTENNESGNDVLNSILLEMDKNPFNVRNVLPKKTLPAEMHGQISLTPQFHSTLSQSQLPVNLLSLEKEKESKHHQSQVENKLPAFSKQATVAVSSSDKSSSISQIRPSINKLENSNKNLKKSKCHETPLVKKRNSWGNTKKTLPTLINSFYSVNPEEYSRPQEVQNYKNVESQNHLIPNTSYLNDASQLKIQGKNSNTSNSKEIMKGNHSVNNKKERRITDVDQLSHLASSVASNAESTSHDHSSSQQNVYTNCIETRDKPNLKNNTNTDKNLKYIELVQSTIDNLTKLLPKNNPSISEKGLVCEEMKTISYPKSSNDSRLGNPVLNLPKEPTSPLEVGTINNYVVSNKEVKESPDKENNIISGSKPSKGIRVRFGGSVYRLPGKENVIDSNTKATEPKEIIPSTTTESKNQTATDIPPNSVNDNNINNPCTDNRERKSDKSSSSSEDSSDESLSSEDRLVVSEKSSSGNSSSESNSEDEKELSDIQSMKPSSKISTKGKIIKNKKATNDKTNLNNTIPKVSELKEHPKDKRKSFSLDQLLGFHKKNKIEASLTTESSCNVISDDAIILSSSSEGESTTGTNNNSLSKFKSLEKKDSTVIDKNSEINSTKTVDDKSKDPQNPNLNDQIENKGWKIRVKSFKELGISNASSVPDNALQPPRSVAVESKEQSFESQPLSTPNALNVFNPTSSKRIDSVAKKKATAQSSPLKRKAPQLKEGTNIQISKVLHLLQNESHKTVNEPNIKECNSSATTTNLHKTKTISDDKMKPNFFSEQNDNVSANTCLSKQPVVSKQTISSQFNAFKNIDKSTYKQCFPQSEKTANETTPRPSETGNTVTNPLVWGTVPRGTVLAIVRMPIMSNSTTENSTANIATSPSCSRDNPQNINKPTSESTGKDGSTKTPNLNEFINPVTPEDLESQFFKLCDELFCEVVMMKIPKLVDDLHLVITHDIMREERLKKVEQLKCPETKQEEKRRTEKEFTDMLKIRGQGFVPLFMTIVRKIENKESLRTLVIALYCKIIHQLEQIDQINSAYRFKLKLFIQKMLLKNNINHEVCAIFCGSDTSFATHFHFIESLLFKYDQFVLNRNKIRIRSASDKNNEAEPVQIKSHTENSEKVDSSKSSTSQCGKTTTVIMSDAEPSSCEQTAETILNSNHITLQAQTSRRSHVNPPFGNLDQILLGSFLKTATGRKF